MPQILIDHSAGLDFDRQGLARALHPLIAEVIDTTEAECKTVFRPAAECYTGAAAAPRPLVLVEVKILDGRSTEQRAELTARILALLQSHLPEPATVAVEVTELDRATYRIAY
ncbi:5-carboxymethyl-2-hydroxymuconate Delta-isomerase [Kitasatospora sp. NPDC006697]|uniref:5-carboxymethyl-2-hydroxymuconate Delta-isomerase n=1 Tax=Kitasatospora sp. NPDC006697 TaxID=3364020 RepID=UPI00369EBBBD